MRLLLVRHGETPANVMGSLDTALPGPGLTDHGRDQAAAIPAALDGERVDGLWTSQALRTQETAAPLAQARGLRPVVLTGAHEIQAGQWERRTDPDAVTAYLETLGSWANGDLEVRMPGAESGHEVLGRMDASVRAIADSGAQVGVLVSHGAIIRTWTCIRSANLGRNFARNNPLGNTGVVVVEGDPDSGWVTTSWMGTALGGPGVDDNDPYDGPAGHPFVAE